MTQSCSRSSRTAKLPREGFGASVKRLWMSVESGWRVSKVSGAKDAAEVVAGGLPEITPQWAAFNLSLAADEACLI